jgi:hypothetical protein
MTDAREPRPTTSRTRRRLKPRENDFVNLVLFLGAAVLLLSRVADARAGMAGRAAAAALGAGALFGAWQMARRRFFPGRMPERWGEGEPRLKWLRVVHGTVLIVGSVVFFGYGIGYFLAPARFSRTTSWLVVVGYFVVISMMSDFLRDREPEAELPER